MQQVEQNTARFLQRAPHVCSLSTLPQCTTCNSPICTGLEHVAGFCNGKCMGSTRAKMASQLMISYLLAMELLLPSKSAFELMKRDLFIAKIRCKLDSQGSEMTLSCSLVLVGALCTNQAVDGEHPQIFTHTSSAHMNAENDSYAMLRLSQTNCTFM